MITSLTADPTCKGLQILARQINERELVIDSIRRQVEARMRQAAPEIILQGQALLAAKSHVRHGEWQDWLKTNTKVPERTARRYMARAVNATLSDYYHLLCDGEEVRATQAEGKDTPPYVEAVKRVSRLSGYLTRFPVAGWPAQGREQLKAQLLPIASALWPWRFVSAATAAPPIRRLPGPGASTQVTQLADIMHK